jgi:kumamolisin
VQEPTGTTTTTSTPATMVATGNGAAVKAVKFKSQSFCTPNIKFPNAQRLSTSYTASQLALRYGFPVITKPTGQYVAIIELTSPQTTTGWSENDFKAYCGQVGIPEPPIMELSVRGATNTYTNNGPNSGDTEMALDMQVVAGATLGTVGLLLVYAPNDNTGIGDALAAINNVSDATVSCVSLSWGEDESSWDDASRTACDTALEALLARGIPTFAASGDDGARDNDPNHNMGKNADYPAASPYSFGCGGTTITGNDITTEKAWSSGGGGVSMYYQVPSWQEAAANGVSGNNGMRCVPDAAMDADPASGYSIICNGAQVVGGTSAVAPMWAAWKSLTDGVAGKVLPFSAQSIYELNDLTDISTGNNGTFKAQKGYDLCTGLGVPNSAFTAAWLKQNGASFTPSPQTVLTGTA